MANLMPEPTTSTPQASPAYDAAGEAAAPRFRFGKNWSLFLEQLSPPQIEQAEQSLRQWLGMDSLAGRRFLDIGSGSGLFSLAARRMGARVHSFDYDADSVACTAELKRRYFNADADWRVERGSALDADYLATLGSFDVVYSWGVLHHTGQMWRALENAASRVGPGGALFIAIYNDQGNTSRRWWRIKRAYVRGGTLRKRLLELLALAVIWGPTLIRDSLRLDPTRTWRHYTGGRGMTPWRDLVDWVGGFPFEVAKPEKIFEFFSPRGFALEKFTTCGGGLGCNEFLFRRSQANKTPIS